jgi:hypothetical protein
VTRRKRCRGKRKFQTELDAQLALASIRRQGLRPTGKREQRCYSCPHCGAWHLTSQSRG